MKTIIYENERGLFFKNGKLIKVLFPGKYRTFGDKMIIRARLDEKIDTSICTLDNMLSIKSIAQEITPIKVGDDELTLRFVNNQFAEALTSGEYAFWNLPNIASYTTVDISRPDVNDDIPKSVFDKMPSEFFTRIDVKEHQKALLYYDNKLEKILDSGVYYFWNGRTRIECKYIDMRLQTMDIAGQEILTQDKVTIRINFVCNYKFTDYIKANTEINNYESMLYIASQLILREYVSKHRIDEILDNREQISSFMFEKLKEKATEYYIDIIDAGIKDIILPGEIRNIMNTVLIAEKKAQANVITRREEVASTRSLLNTAKIMDENQTLYKLKELEYIERICEHVGNINVTGSADLLTELSKILCKDK